MQGKVQIISVPKVLPYKQVRTEKIPRFMLFPWIWEVKTKIFEMVLPAVYQWRRPNGQMVTMVLESGFQWDGASIPPSAWKIIGKPWDKKFLKASAPHDGGYDTQILPKDELDEVFGEILILEHNDKMKSQVMELAVELAGGPAWKSQETKELNSASKVRVRIT